MFAFIGTLRGWHVAAFADFEEAMVWLSEDEKSARETGTQDGEEPVKIRRSGGNESRVKPKIRPKHSTRPTA